MRCPQKILPLGRKILFYLICARMTNGRKQLSNKWNGVYNKFCMRFKVPIILFIFAGLFIRIPLIAFATTITVIYNGTTFSPQTTSINVNDTVIWTNQSSSYLELVSDPHPFHTDYPPLNLGLIAPGASTQFTFTEAGTYGYHNHLQANATGTIIVAPAPSDTFFTLADLKELLTTYEQVNDTAYFPIDGKINLLDAGYVISHLN